MNILDNVEHAKKSKIREVVEIIKNKKNSVNHKSDLDGLHCGVLSSHIFALGSGIHVVPLYFAFQLQFFILSVST